MPPPLRNKSDMFEYMDNNMVKYRFREQSQTFLPKSALELVTTREHILQVIEQDDNLPLSNHEQMNLVDRVYQVGRSLFATCVYCDASMKHLKAMLDNGLTDTHLPLQKSRLESLKQLRLFVSGFLGSQKHFKTISFSTGFNEMLDARLSEYFSIPIDFEESSANFKGNGAYGQVWKVRIHKDHRSFPCKTNSDDLFAMKVTQHEGREQAYHRAMLEIGHPHLVKCLTSFAYGTKYHMVYELATCDLEHFMQTHPDGARAPGLTTNWLTQQLAGIAGALKAVHKPKQLLPTSSMLSVPQQSSEKTGYIHDIKPENILVFTYPGQKHWLRLSDFSCARVAELVATMSGKRDSYKTGTKPGTPTYRAPESHNGVSSRPYDMWSLGCVYLELLVWYLDGFAALQTFRESRGGFVRPGGLEDEGFYCEDHSGDVQLRGPVVDMIDYLSHRCSDELCDLIEAIPSLLVIEPTQRLDASQLLGRLEHLDTSVDSPVKHHHSGAFLGPATTSSSYLPTFDSDSDFDDVITVTRPSGD